MKLKKIIVFFIIAFLFVFGNSYVSATNKGFELEKESLNDKQIWFELLELNKLDNEIKGKGIKSFDVNENGWVALSFESGQRKYICIYDSNMQFQYGYSLTSDSEIFVNFGNDNTEDIIIYFSKNNTAASIDRNGNWTNVNHIVESAANKAYWESYVKATTKTVGDTTYTMHQGNHHSLTYSKLTKTDASGNVSILYKSNLISKIVSSPIYFVPILIICAVVFICFKCGIIKPKKVFK